jgi:predicted acyltransferase
MSRSATATRRWRSLDVFRGLTVLGMILVNAADLGGDAYPWLRHAEWDGLTLADLVFPSFLFIVGAALGLATANSPSSDAAPRTPQRLGAILRRASILFALGFASNVAHARGFSDVRIMGVLQRIGLCYGLAAIVLLYVPRALQPWLASVILLGYAALLAYVSVPDDGLAGSELGSSLPGYIDRRLLGESHLLSAAPYEARLDPEGLLSTLPAIVNVLIGAFCGRWLVEQPLASRTTRLLCAAGLASIATGLGFSVVLPINKTLWTSSFALVSSGLAALGLAACYELADVRERASWLRFAEVLGLNAIAAYLLSTMVDMLATELPLAMLADEETPYVWLRAHVLQAWNAPAASLLFALGEVLLIWLVMYLLYRRAWFFKI